MHQENSTAFGRLLLLLAVALFCSISTAAEYTGGVVGVLAMETPSTCSWWPYASEQTDADRSAYSAAEAAAKESRRGCGANRTRWRHGSSGVEAAPRTALVTSTNTLRAKEPFR